MHEQFICLGILIHSRKENAIMDERIQKIVESNIGLVGHCLKKCNISPADSDDMFSVGTLGLIKAARSFDETRKITFATYATRCITNEIFMEFRRRKKQRKDISLDEPLATDFDGSHLYLKDILSDESNEVESHFVATEKLERTLDIIINRLRKRERLTILLHTAGYTQREISDMTDISQSYASRILTKVRNNIREKSHSKTNVRKYAVRVTPGKVSVSFKGSMEVVERIVENEKSFKEAPMYILKAKENGNVELVVMTDPESMALLAFVLDKLEKR